MTKKLRNVKQDILNILSNKKSSVMEIASYAPHMKSNERIFAICNDGTNRYADFSVRYFTDNIIRYEIRFDYKTKISRIVFSKSKIHRPGARAMMEIHAAISLKSITK